MALVKIGRAYQEAAYRKTEVPDEIVQKTLTIDDKHPKDSLLKLWAGAHAAE